MRHWAWVALVVASAACWDFNGAYDAYCVKTGQCGDGGAFLPDASFPDAGVDGGQSPDAGRDAGTDAGPVSCVPWGGNCAAPGDCCAGPDAGGRALGCSNLGFCEYRPSACTPPGYHCDSTTNCCGGTCSGGSCVTACGGANFHTYCAKASDCCSFQGAECKASFCAPYDGADGVHCLSSDFCFNGFCLLNDAGTDGICQPAGSPCVALNQPGRPCCAGLTTVCLALDAGCASGGDPVCCSNKCDPNTLRCATGPGDGGTCQLPTGQACLNGGSCASGVCEYGACVPVYFPREVGDGCLLLGDCDPNVSNLFCDTNTTTCETSFCFPQQVTPGWGGCGVVPAASTSQVDLTDGGACFYASVSCSTGPSCCSGVCATVSFPTPHLACAGVAQQ